MNARDSCRILRLLPLALVPVLLDVVGVPPSTSGGSSGFPWRSHNLYLSASAASRTSESIHPPVGIPVEHPSYSPDGREVVFNTTWPGKVEIWVVSTVNGRLRLLASGPPSHRPHAGEWPAWSPDGKWIAFASASIQLVRPDGTDRTQLNTRGLAVAGEPAWSPDGTEIVFASDVRDLWVIKADGSALWRVTNLPQSWAPNLSRHLQSAYHPAFSPDGRQIVFSQGSSPKAIGPSCGVNKLVIVNTDGTGARQLTAEVAAAGPPQVFDSYPSWSKRGILFASSRCGSPPEIKMIQPTGTDLQAIPNAAGWQPAWSPDGTRFVFVRAGDYVHNVSGYGIYEYNVSSGAIRALVQIRGYFITIDIMPGVSPKVVSLKETALIRIVIRPHSGFDPVREIDQSSITFGRTGEERSLDSCAVDGVNLVCQFKTASAGFRAGDTQGILRLITVSTTLGSTSRVRYEGRGTLRVVP